MLEWFKSKGIKRVELSVDVRNKIGVSAWTKFRFSLFENFYRFSVISTRNR